MFGLGLVSRVDRRSEGGALPWGQDLRMPRWGVDTSSWGCFFFRQEGPLGSLVGRTTLGVSSVQRCVPPLAELGSPSRPSTSPHSSSQSFLESFSFWYGPLWATSGGGPGPGLLVDDALPTFLPAAEPSRPWWPWSEPRRWAGHHEVCHLTRHSLLGEDALLFQVKRPGLEA